MGELRAVAEDLMAEDITSIGSRERYRQNKARLLAEINPAKEYAVMGKIYCANCKAEISLDMPERNLYVKCVCDCESKRQAQEAYKKSRLDAAKKYRWQNEQVIPVEDGKASFYGIFDGQRASEDYINACSRCEKFCKVFPSLRDSGRGIWLCGEADSGKTYLAVAMLNKLQAEGSLCIFTTAERIFEELKATYKSDSNFSEREIMAKYSEVDCLFLDDFRGIKPAHAKADNWAESRFGEIVKRRYDKKRPTVITSRETIRDLSVKNMLSREIVEKLVNRQVVIRLTGTRRKAEQTEMEF